MAWDRVMVFGFIGSKGTFDDGRQYDSGKVLVLRPLNSQRNSEESFRCGQFTQEFPLGAAALARRFIDDVTKPFAPREMEVNFEIVSSGKGSQVIVTDVRPITTATDKARAAA